MNKALEETEGYLCYWNDDIKELTKVNLLDVFRKLKADHFIKSKPIRNLDLKYKELANTKPKIKFDIERSFHNCKATLSFVFTKNKEETIGIQMEDNQFRLFKGNGDMSPDQIFQEYSNKGWFIHRMISITTKE